jgi:hypothetical protein
LLSGLFQTILDLFYELYKIAVVEPFSKVLHRISRARPGGGLEPDECG